MSSRSARPSKPKVPSSTVHEELDHVLVTYDLPEDDWVAISTVSLAIKDYSKNSTARDDLSAVEGHASSDGTLIVDGAHVTDLSVHTPVYG